MSLEFNPTKSIIILGYGFVSKYLVESLLNKTELQIVVISSNLTNKRYFSSNNRIKFVYSNYEKDEVLEKKISYYKPQTLILSGWDTSSLYINEKKNKTHDDKNIKYYIWISELIIKYGCKHIIGLGSCAEYQTSINCEEYKSKLSNSSIYAEQKNELRKALDYLCKSKNVKLGWLRIFALYGPNDKKTSIIYKLINSSLNQSICECILTPRLRDYIFIDDLIKILNSMILNQYHGILNAGTGKSFSINNLIDVISDITNKKPIIEWQYQCDNLKGNTLFDSNWVANTSLVKKSLSIRFTSIEEGIKKYTLHLLGKER